MQVRNLIYLDGTTSHKGFAFTSYGNAALVPKTFVVNIQTLAFLCMLST